MVWQSAAWGLRQLGNKGIGTSMILAAVRSFDPFTRRGAGRVFAYQFYGMDELDGRAILVRYAWSNITPNSAHFEQAFSVDGGKTWEVNWIAVDTRVK